VWKAAANEVNANEVNANEEDSVNVDEHEHAESDDDD
jgi:hypothetical protein